MAINRVRLHCSTASQDHTQRHSLVCVVTDHDINLMKP